MSLTLDIIGFLVVVWVAVILNRQLEVSGFKRDPFNAQKLFANYKCDRVLPDGADSIAVTDDGIAFITNGLKYPPHNAPPGDGEIYMMDLTDPEDNLSVVKISAPFDPKLKLNPHGIDVYEPGDGRILVYVVNHGSKIEKIEKFQYK